MRFSELLQLMGIDPHSAHLASDPDLVAVAPLGTATPNQLSFFENKQFFNQLQTTQAGAVFLPDDDRLQPWIADHPHIAHLITKQPRLMFAKAIALLHPPHPHPPGIHPKAVVDDSATIDPTAHIGAGAVIGAGVQIGASVQIHANCTIYPEVSIGDRTVIYANAVIHPRTIIGQDCVIHSGAVIGSEGFGFVPDRGGIWTKMPQVGRVVIEDMVEIGCNTCIDRGAITDTRIGQGTKIDNLVQIAHGCQTGQNCLMAGQVGLSGGVILGDQVTLGGQVGIANHLHIGDRASVAAQSGILDNLPPQSQVMGYPAFPAPEFFKATAVFKRLPEMRKTLLSLQKQIQQLLKT